jgi:hypothetical protein
VVNPVSNIKMKRLYHKLEEGKEPGPPC